MSASVGLTRPDLVAGFAVLAGRILPELESQLAEPNALAHLQGFIGHGRDDTKLPVDWAYRADAWLTKLQIRHETRLYPGDHAIPVAMQSDFFAWFEQVTTAASAIFEDVSPSDWAGEGKLFAPDSADGR